MLRAKFIASGTVQGVGFREFARRMGEDCGLCGYAKNLEDGTVEIVAEGEKESLDRFAERISVKMRFSISVEKLETVEEKEISKPVFEGFSVAY